MDVGVSTNLLIKITRLTSFYYLLQSKQEQKKYLFEKFKDKNLLEINVIMEKDVDQINNFTEYKLVIISGLIITFFSNIIIIIVMKRS